MAYQTIPPGGLTPPVVIDGTVATTSVPLLIKNGKNLSGVEVQVTGSAASGYVLRDSTGTQQGAFGLNVNAADWSASSQAGESVLVGPVTVGKRLVIQGGSAAGVFIAGSNGSASLTVDNTTGVTLAFGGNTLVINGSSHTFTGLVNVGSGLTMTGGALATNATLGFPFLRTMAGTPTGAVADGAFVIDTTASKIWARIGGAWKQTVALT